MARQTVKRLENPMEETNEDNSALLTAEPVEPVEETFVVDPVVEHQCNRVYVATGVSLAGVCIIQATDMGAAREQLRQLTDTISGIRGQHASARLFELSGPVDFVTKG